MFQDFKLNSEPGMSGSAGEAGLGPPQLCSCNLCLLPKVGLQEKLAVGEGPSDSSPHRGTAGKGLQAQDSSKASPGSIQTPTNVCESRKLFIFHPPTSSSTRLLKTVCRQAEKEPHGESDKTKREKARKAFSFSAQNFKTPAHQLLPSGLKHTDRSEPGRCTICKFTVRLVGFFFTIIIFVVEDDRMPLLFLFVCLFFMRC